MFYLPDEKLGSVIIARNSVGSIFRLHGRVKQLSLVDLDRFDEDGSGASAFAVPGVESSRFSGS